MKLRDGRRIITPEMMPLAPISANPFYALSPNLEGIKTFSAMEDEDSLPMVEWTEDSPSELSTSPTNFEFEHHDDTREDEVLWVEPLVMSIPAEGEKYEKKDPTETIPMIRGPVSDWVSGKMIDFREFLGASYKGYEDRVMTLLSDIEASSGIHTTATEAKSKIPRELKNLISNINYEGGSSKRRTPNRGGALMLSK
jgi:hypothetical protein